jgi:hypothetical protein
MKIVYMCVFFGDTLVISVLAFQLFQSIDTGVPVWVQLTLGLALVAAIMLLVLFIRHYLRGGTGPNDK